MQELIIQPNPNQTFDILLDNQNCTIRLYQKGSKMYLDLAIDNISISYGNICLNRTSILQYIGADFKGVLFFYDTLGANDPYYDGVGNRYKLLFISEGEIPPEGLLT